MKIPEQVELALSKSGKKIFTRKEILQIMSSISEVNESSVIPSDYCYNRTNDGIDQNQKPDPKFLIFNGGGSYTYVGFNNKYTGLVYHKPKNQEPYIKGQWVNGEYYSQENSDIKIESDIAQIIEEKNVSVTDKLAIVNARIGQGRYRKQLIDLWGRCSVTGYNEPSLLIASHIKPWRGSSNEERLDRYNGLLLQPNLDKAFDTGLISFSEAGRFLFLHF